MIQPSNQGSQGKLRIKRLEREELKVNAKKKLFPENFIFLGPIMTDHGKNIEKWQFKFRGKMNSPFEKGYYDVLFEFPKDYPNVAPKVKFMNDFRHMHVYLSGDICLPLIDQMRWSMNISIYDIACAISSMIHGKPNPEDRASDHMKNLYLDKGEEAYWNFIKDQAEKFAQYENYAIQLNGNQV